MARPLTKAKDGAVYVRPPAVESHIDQVVGLDPSTLGERLAVTDPKSPLYVRPECRLHLVREALRSGDDRKANASMGVLSPNIARLFCNRRFGKPGVSTPR